MSDLIQRLANSLAVFTKHYDTWMERWGDDEQSSTFSRHTFGELRQARKLIEEADALPTAWQSIETAPKDWIDVLLFVPDYPNDHRKVLEGYFDADLECWRDADTSLRQEIFPTHWQPLPEIPTNALRQGRKEAGE